MALGKLTKKTCLGSRRAEEDLGLFSPVYVLQGQQLTAEILYFKSMEAHLNGHDNPPHRRTTANSPQ
jgi:hypothetical protein